MIVEIKGRTNSGKTSAAIKLLDDSKYTVVRSLDGDFESVYKHVTGNDIHEDFGDKIHISIGNIIKNNGKYDVINDDIINDFLNSNNEVMVLDQSWIPESYLQSLHKRLNSEFSNHKTLILVRATPVTTWEKEYV